MDIRAAGRTASFVVVVATYLAAGAAAWLTAAALAPGGWHPLAVTLLADVVATLVVFAASMMLDNASLYDPYWSVAPPAIAVAWLATASGGSDVRGWLVAALIALWSVRLTGNWAYGWRGLHQVDWRYDQLRAGRGRVPWWVVNLGGIQLMPTLVVFAGMLPVWAAVTGGRPLGWLDALAVVVTAGAIALETVADLQLHRFAADPANRGRYLAAGAWSRSRHPNYLGEIGFWCGLWLFGLAALPGDWWWTLAGPVVMVLLFRLASIPLMDRRSLERRAGYAEHMACVPALLPLPPGPARPR